METAQSNTQNTTVQTNHNNGRGSYVGGPVTKLAKGVVTPTDDITANDNTRMSGGIHIVPICVPIRNSLDAQRRKQYVK
jgi:hypothetical protein